MNHPQEISLSQAVAASDYIQTPLVGRLAEMPVVITCILERTAVYESPFSRRRELARHDQLFVDPVDVHSIKGLRDGADWVGRHGRTWYLRKLQLQREAAEW